MDPPTEAELEEDRLRSKAATIAHDAKVRAYVEPDPSGDGYRLFAGGDRNKLWITNAAHGALVGIVARVGGRKECVSRAGRYRFVETRNLNAFLMWIERSAGRREADRCFELAQALDCLDGKGR